MEKALFAMMRNSLPLISAEQNKKNNENKKKYEIQVDKKKIEPCTTDDFE